MVVAYLSVLSQVCRLFMHVHIGGECFRPVINSNSFLLFFALAPMFFFK